MPVLTRTLIFNLILPPNSGHPLVIRATESRRCHWDTADTCLSKYAQYSNETELAFRFNYYTALWYVTTDCSRLSYSKVVCHNKPVVYALWRCFCSHNLVELHLMKRDSLAKRRAVWDLHMYAAQQTYRTYHIN